MTALRPRFAADRDMRLKVALVKVGHFEAVGVFRREWHWDGLLRDLDSQDDKGSALPPLLGAEYRVARDFSISVQCWNQMGIKRTQPPGHSRALVT